MGQLIECLRMDELWLPVDFNSSARPFLFALTPLVLWDT
jgi:hypothetical protein